MLTEIALNLVETNFHELEPDILEQAIYKAQKHLLELQHPNGYWVGDLEADASVTAGYIPLMYFMGVKVDEGRVRKIIHYVKGKQNQNGSWSSYQSGDGDLNVSIQVYFCLKLAGVLLTEPFMQQAAGFIRSKGGVSKASVFTKIWLALFGQYQWSGTPSVPPEVILLPNWFYFNIYEFASWSRETIMALAVVTTTRPVCEVPPTAGIEELYLEPEGEREYRVGKASRLFSWQSFFLLVDRFFKIYERSPLKPGRQLAMRKAEQWIVSHQEPDGSWGGIMLPWIYSLFALKSLGYTLEHPTIQLGTAGLEGFILENEGDFILQPAVSPVWDTAWAALALCESGLPADQPALQKAAVWMLDQEIRVDGDWKIKNPDTMPGGWAFEFENDLYPDLDDSALVPRALRNIRLSEEQEKEKAQAIRRCIDWVLSMQSKDGGWAAFDRDNDMQFLNYVPFAEFMSPLDPTCPDVTAHIIEMLVEEGSHPQALFKAIEYLKNSQEADGAWYGRWGVNYLYGTGLVLAALGAAGENPQQETILRGVDWLISVQNPDGGWGESCKTYENPSQRGSGPSTASQTSWAVTGLLGAGRLHSLETGRGIEYLLKSQKPDGSWDEAETTGTGFPRVFYLRYDLYRNYFPLLALARYRNGLRNQEPGAKTISERIEVRK
ncbi:MAG: squalene--hopene cyclase [Chloroflexi bacterium RBG_16_54_18]|nr:MAG: squalene--hopene cyclase [Chloroflexi bacterium RBG_16_54_18]